MYIKEIKEMINLMNENNLTELEIERDGLKIRLKKTSTGISQEISQVQAQGLSAPLAGQKEAAEKEKAVKTIEISAPMVGTFYRAPAPDAAPFVEEGDEIDIDQVICIIEAMKLMNEIKSEIKGRIIKIMVDNGDPVEFGQPLFVIEPF